MSVVVTTWHRLEQKVRGCDPSEGLQAAVHDPLWALGRQWQVGELLGEDAAFPVAVQVDTLEHRINRFRPGGPPADGAAPVEAQAYDPSSLPLEVAVEREPPVAPTLRQRLDAWTRLHALAEDANEAAAAETLAAAHPLPPARVAEDPADARLRLLAGTGAGDGLAIAQRLASDPAGLSQAVVETFLAWVQAQSPAGAGDSWVVDRLEYRFALGASVRGEQHALVANDYTGQRLDWYAMDVDPVAGAAGGLGASDAPTPFTANLLPLRVSFPGMPAERFWEFEDAVVDLGALTASAEDLGRVLAVEFATVFGNDWWQVPVPARFGSLIEVRRLVVRDTFGDQTLVEHTARATATRSLAPWRMFAMSDASLAAGSGPSPALLLLAPVVAGGLDGESLEELLLLRDEMANMAWGVERVVEGADGRPRNRSVEYRSAVRAAALPQRASPAELVYLLQTQVPAHWIPLVPVRDPAQPDVSGAVVLQRGTLLTQDGSMRPVTAQGVLLSPEVSPWYFHEEEVPRAGLRIARVPAVARWLDGTPHHWVSRRVNAGRGEGSSGLQFDLALPAAPQP